MSKVNLDSFQVVGLSVRTSNKNGAAAQQIPALWQKFMSEGTMSRIGNKVNQEIYAVYTNYEGDHNLPYDFVLGCKVNSVEELPSDLVSVSVAASTYEKFLAKGNLTEGKVVFEAWQKIWASDMDRSFAADFEVYGSKTANMENAEVDIFVSVK